MSRSSRLIPVQAFAPGLVAEVVRRQAASPERTRFAWAFTVGPALARVTTITLDDRVLQVRSPDPRWLREVRRAGPAILQKMQHLLGADAVRALRARDPGE